MHLPTAYPWLWHTADLWYSCMVIFCGEKRLLSPQSHHTALQGNLPTKYTSSLLPGTVCTIMTCFSPPHEGYNSALMVITALY